MKKLFGIVTAALMLLLALPFGAMAEAKTGPARSGLDDALNAADTDLALVFVSEGAYPWIVMNEGEYAQSGNKGVHDSKSTLTAEFTCDEEFILSFDYKAWGEGIADIWDACVFILDGEEIFRKGQEQNDWLTYTFETPLEAGEHTLEWYYEKDVAMSKPGDYFALKNVKLEKANPDPEILWGDANGDGEVTAADALLLMRSFIDLDTVEQENLALCDVNGDGEINLMDALMIMRKTMGVITAFPVEK